MHSAYPNSRNNNPRNTIITVVKLIIAANFSLDILFGMICKKIGEKN